MPMDYILADALIKKIVALLLAENVDHYTVSDEKDGGIKYKKMEIKIKLK